MKKILLAWFWAGTLAAFAGSVALDFARSAGDEVRLQKDARIENSLLRFSEKAGVALLRNTEKLDFSDGGTLMMVVKVADYARNPSKSRFLVWKENSFLFGITGGKYNFSLCNNGTWSIALIGGIPPEDGEFVHLAAVARRVNNHEQSEVGFFMDVYLNGEKITSKFHPIREYSASRDAEIRINVQPPETHFSGDVAQFVFTTKILSAAEIAAAAKSHPLVKIKPAPGIFEIPEKLSAALTDAAKRQSDKLCVFTVESLRKAAATGAPHDKVFRALEALASLGTRFSAEKFNAVQKDFALLPTANGTAFLILGECGAAFPVVDLFDPQIGSGIFGSRSNSWLIRYHHGKEKYCRLSDFSPEVKTFCQLKSAENGKYVFDVTWKHPLIHAVSRGVFSADGLSMDLNAEAQKRDIRMANYRFPYWILRKKAGSDYLVTPRWSGRLIPSPTDGYEYSSKFPRADNTMQFQAYFGGKEDGVYTAMEDPEGTFRLTGVFGKSHELHIFWQTDVALPQADRTSAFSMRADSRVALYRGKWYEAGQIYKRFLREKASWWIKTLPRTSTPLWFRENAIWILAGVAPNRNEATLLYLRKYFEQSFGVHLVAHTKKRIWPHFDKSTDLGKRRRGNLQRAGLRVIAYSDPRIYSEVQLDGSKGWAAEQIAWAVKGEDGQPVIESYGDRCLVLCPQNRPWRNDYLRICAGMAQNGFDGIYHDQLPCGQPMACFAENHGHLPNDPRFWIENGYKVMFRDIRKYLDRQHPGMAHTGEDASEPYVRMVDGFMTWRWIQQDQIPLFQSVYSGRVQFVGKLYNHQNPGEWDSNFAKAASQVVNGEQLGWVTLEDLEAATPFRRYYKVLSFVRKALLRYFNAGDMAAPVEFVNAPEMRTLNWGESSRRRGPLRVKRPVVESSSWQLPDGRKMILFINTSDTVQRVTAKLPGKAAYIYICRQSSSVPEVVTDVPETVLAPYGVEVWLFGDRENRAEAARVAAILHRTAGFDEGRTLTVKKVVAQKVPEDITTRAGELVPVTLAAKYTNTFKRYFANGEDKDTVLILYEGSTLSYRGVTLKQPSLALVVAYDASEVGGRFEVFINGEKAGDAPLNAPGGYLRFQTLEVPLRGEFPGKKDLEIRFHGKSCRIKGFTVKDSR